MRRPGNLAGTNYWFGEVGKIKRSMVDEKLAMIMAAKKKNATPLTDAQRRSKLLDVLKGKKPTNDALPDCSSGFPYGE